MFFKWVWLWHIVCSFHFSVAFGAIFEPLIWIIYRGNRCLTLTDSQEVQRSNYFWISPLSYIYAGCFTTAQGCCSSSTITTSWGRRGKGNGSLNSALKQEASLVVSLCFYRLNFLLSWWPLLLWLQSLLPIGQQVWRHPTLSGAGVPHWSKLNSKFSLSNRKWNVSRHIFGILEVENCK